MEKITVPNCSQVPASRVLVLLAALQGCCHGLMTLTKQRCVAWSLRCLRCASLVLCRGLYTADESLVLLSLE